MPNAGPGAVNRHPRFEPLERRLLLDADPAGEQAIELFHEVAGDEDADEGPRKVS